MKWTAEKIKALRHRIGDTQAEFAKRFRVSVTAIQYWEQDRGAPLGPVEELLDRIEDDFREGRIEKSTQPAA